MNISHKNNKFRGLTAAITTIAASALLLTGCTGDTAANTLDGVYIGADETDHFAVIDGDTVELYAIHSGTNAEYNQRLIDDIELLTAGETEGVSEKTLQASGTFREINGQNVIEWDKDERRQSGIEMGGKTLTRLPDSLIVTEGEYFPLDGELAQDSLAELEEYVTESLQPAIDRAK